MKNSRMKITIKDAETFATVCAQLVREGVNFEALQVSKNEFVIEFTGGF